MSGGTEAMVMRGECIDEEAGQMGLEREECPYKPVHEVQFRCLSEDLKELKGRVQGLETMLGRGVMLLVANLVGVVVSLARQLM